MGRGTPRANFGRTVSSCFRVRTADLHVANYLDGRRTDAPPEYHSGAYLYRCSYGIDIRSCRHPEPTSPHIPTDRYLQPAYDPRPSPELKQRPPNRRRNLLLVLVPFESPNGGEIRFKDRQSAVPCGYLSGAQPSRGRATVVPFGRDHSGASLHDPFRQTNPNSSRLAQRPSSPSFPLDRMWLIGHFLLHRPLYSLVVQLT
jgi:hypothetical protein